MLGNGRDMSSSTSTVTVKERVMACLSIVCRVLILKAPGSSPLRVHTVKSRYVIVVLLCFISTLDLRRVFFTQVSLGPTGCRSTRTLPLLWTKRGEAGLP